MSVTKRYQNFFIIRLKKDHKCIDTVRQVIDQGILEKQQ
jgi:hypothetical protein